MRVLTVLTALLGPMVAYAWGQAEPPKRIRIRVVYVGRSGSARQKDFVALLRGHFRDVQVADPGEFDPGKADAADVTILDCDSRGFDVPHIRFPDDYARPTILVGLPGALIWRSCRLKTGYL
jgi:hypothetical protein